MASQQRGLPKILTSVQGLRGMAALLVLLYHMAAGQRQVIQANGQMADMGLLRGPWDRGWAGVDLFFVISGFIMVYVTRTQWQKPGAAGNLAASWRFLRARMARIYPLWWFYAASTALVLYLIHGVPVDVKHVHLETGVSSYLVNSFALLPQGAPPVLGQGWTLVHEMFFYLLFAVFLLLTRKFQLWALFAWMIAVGLGAFAGVPKPQANNVLELAVSYLSLEFIFGAFTAWLIVRMKFTRFSRFALWFGIAGFMAGMVFFQADYQTTMTWGRVVVFGPPGVLIVYGLVAREVSVAATAPLPLKLLGDWSYSMYLSHTLVLSVLRRIFAHLADVNPVFQIGRAGMADNLLFLGVGLLASISFAAVSFYFIERPLLFGSRKLLRMHRVR